MNHEPYAAGTMEEAMNGTVMISFSRHPAKGYLAVRIPFDRIEGVVRFEGNYSATAFRDGYRDGEHAMQGQELVILDFDARYTIGEAMVDFEEYIALVATTRNHLKEKHGVVAERFRVILPTDKPIMLERGEFKVMMAEVMARFPQADQACKNIDRMYYGHTRAEIFVTGGSRLFDWESFYRLALERKSAKASEWSGRVRRPDCLSSVQRSYATFFQREFVPGNRNSALFRLACWMKSDGVADPELRIRELNYGSPAPLQEDELRKILRVLE
ncbi:MAG: primase C-terminal domain-containing protein [Chlorobiales bacterium]|nr:primase C-terminal domain-containing protein [Chlorobiales bacterium]